MKNQEPKLFFASNLKFLRERRKLSQETLAENLGITRGKLALIEIGKTKSMEPDFWYTVSEYFKMSLDTLFKVDLAKVGELKLRDLEAGNDIYIKGGHLRVLAITVDKRNNENIEYVPISAKMGYSAGGYADPEFLEKELPKFSMPNIPQTGSFRLFTGQGDSMLPIPDGSDIIGKYVTDWSLLKARTPAVVVLNTEQDIVFKFITIQEDGMVLLESLNQIFKPYYVTADNIAEIWEFYSYHSREIPAPQTDLNIVLKEISELKSAVMDTKNHSS